MTNTIKNIVPTEKEFVNTIGDEHSKRIEDEIDAIRIALYEETKGMTDQEFEDHIDKEIAPIMEQLRLRSISRVVEQKSNEVNKTTG
jgi:hypothetical protein